LYNITTGALASFTAGIWAAADAAITGADGFGMAMAKMLKATLLSIAQESTVQVLVHLAKAAANWWNGVGVVAELTAAGAWGVAAAAAGAAGLAVSSGIGSAGGYDTAKRDSSRASTTGTNSYKPAFGTQKESTAPININVYIGDKGNPSTAMLLTKQISTQLKSAA